MRLNKQNKIIVGVLALILTITVGYAVFSQSLNITGTAKAEGNFSLIFERDEENNPKCDGYSNECNIDNLSSISTDKRTLSITVDKLNYPTAYVQIPVKIKNEGSIDAILKAIKVEGLTNDDIEVTYSITDEEIKKGYIIKANESKNMTVKVLWKEDSTNTSPGTLNFTITLEYEQATSLADSGSGENDTESDWTFKVNDTGTITAYNYEKGSDVVVPAEVDGVAVTTITADSFKQEANLIAYMDEDAGKMYIVIKENEPNFSVVKEKVMLLLSSECDEGDTECLEQYKQMIYICTNEKTCYNVKAEEEGNAEVESISQTVMENGADQMIVDTDPNVSLEDSFNELIANISTLDLSEATNLTAIEEYSFKFAGLQSVNFGEDSNLKTIGNDAFHGNQLSTLTIPESVEEIGDYAFSSNNITSVTFKQNDNTLANNSSVKASYLSESNNNKVSKLAENTTGLKTIGNEAFSRNQISGELIIPNSVTSIGNSAFYDNQISSLTIPKTVTLLGSSAFSSNPIITLNIGKYISNMNSYSFGNQVKTLTIESGEVGSQAFYSSNSTGTIESLTLGDEVTSIGNLAFSSNQISSLAFEENSSLETIGENAFSSNQISGELVIPNSVTTIGNLAFSSNQISSLTIPNSVTTIENAAFYSNQISSLTIPNSVTTIENAAFYSNQISNLTIPNGVTSIGYNAFSGNQISSLAFEENSSLETIGENAFKSNQISSLTIPNSVTTIKYGAFESNPLTSILIKRTEEDFLANVTVGSNWYVGNPTIRYQAE